MLRLKNLLLIICLLSGLLAQAQVIFDVKIDSMQLFIGEQTNITLDVTLGTKQKLKFPSVKKGDKIVPNVEIVDILRADTNYINDGKRMEVRQRYTVTAWDSSFYYLPPFVVEVDGKKYESKSLAMKVYTVDIDTLHLDKFFPPYEVMDPPFAWADWKWVIISAFIVIILVVISIVLLYYVVNGKPIVRFIRRKKVLPPHKVAINEIERIKASRNWTVEDSKEYYTELTDTLRNYIKDRYSFNAMEMTSAEIIERLVEDKNEEAINELREIFHTADLVKFAKYTTLINENDSNLMSALEYVNQTKLEEDPNAKPEPEVIKETDQKRMNQVMTMRVIIAVLLLASTALMAWIVWRSIDLLM